MSKRKHKFCFFVIFSLAILTILSNLNSVDYRIFRRIKNIELLPASGYLPLEFEGRSFKDVNIPKWPNLDKIRENLASLSNEAKTLLILPYLVASMDIPKDFGYSVHLIYPLAYLRSLPYISRKNEKGREEVLEKIENIDPELASFLRENCGKDLSQQLEAIKDYFGLKFKGNIKDKIFKWIEKRDQVVSYSRALRIGIESLNIEAERLGKDDISLDEKVLNTIINNPEIASVVFGFKKMATVSKDKISDLNQLKKALWAFRNVEGPIINVVPLNDTTYCIYNEYALRREAIEKKLVNDINDLKQWTTSKLEEWIEDGKFNYLLDQEQVSNEDTSFINNFASPIVSKDKSFNFINKVEEKGEEKTYQIYRGGNLAKQVFELERAQPDTVFIATMNRAKALKIQLEAELVNYEIFRHWAPIVVIDNSKDGEDTDKALSKNKDTIKELRKDYGAKIIHVAKGDDADIKGTEELVREYAQNLAQKYNSGRDLAVEKILEEKGLLENGQVDPDKLFEYLKGNMFYHISGVRNHMLLLAKDDDIIMNFDDDAPPETYMVEEKGGDEIQSLEDQYFPNDFGIKITHQRYESLMDLYEEMLKTGDFVYVSPRQTKENRKFIILPVNTLSQTKLLNKLVKETDLPAFKNDLRGTMGVPEDFEEVKDKRIIYIAFPFVGDQDTSALAQLLSYLSGDNLESVNLQHTNRSAFLNQGVMGFAGNTYVIFNRALLWVGNEEIFPTIGRELRLEEPPYVKWIIAPVMGGKVLPAYAKVGGAQIREIGERAYVIAGQDITEVIGGVARRFYEKAVEKFLKENPDIPKTQEEKMARLRKLGEKFIEVAEKIGEKGINLLTGDEEKILLEHREIRARLMAKLGRRRGEKTQNLEAKNQEIKDIDGALVQWARQFNLCDIEEKKDKDKEIWHYYVEDKKQRENYFYKIWVEDGRLKWQKMVPEMTVERIKGVNTVTKSKWVKIDGSRIYEREIPSKVYHEGKIQEGRYLYKFKIEPERTIIMDKLPEEGNYAIVPALRSDLEDDYLIKIVNKIISSLVSDGETMVLWPDVLDVAKGWRRI
jgi:hypothetical protein